MPGQFGNKGGTGNPGYGALKLIRDNVKKHCPEWWEQWQVLMKDSKMENKRFAMTEFNKLQAKLMPTIVGGDDDSPLILQFHESLSATRKPGKDKSEQSKV